MKEVIIIIALLGLIYTSSGQYNAKLIDSTKTWSIANQP